MKHNQYYDDLENDIVGSCPHDVFLSPPHPSTWTVSTSR